MAVSNTQMPEAIDGYKGTADNKRFWAIVRGLHADIRRHPSENDWYFSAEMGEVLAENDPITAKEYSGDDHGD